MNFFPERGQSVDEAKAVCRRCPVRVECLVEAMERRDKGVWGGTPEKARVRFSVWFMEQEDREAALLARDERRLRKCTECWRAFVVDDPEDRRSTHPGECPRA